MDHPKKEYHKINNTQKTQNTLHQNENCTYIIIAKQTKPRKDKR